MLFCGVDPEDGSGHGFEAVLEEAVGDDDVIDSADGAVERAGPDGDRVVAGSRAHLQLIEIGHC